VACSTGTGVWKCTFAAVLPNRIQAQNFDPDETRAGGPRFVIVTAGTAIIIWPPRETHQESLILYETTAAETERLCVSVSNQQVLL
jgi:hypothetical protein